MVIYLEFIDQIILGPSLGTPIGNDDGVTLSTNDESFDRETQ